MDQITNQVLDIVIKKKKISRLREIGTLYNKTWLSDKVYISKGLTQIKMFLPTQLATAKAMQKNKSPTCVWSNKYYEML